LALVAAGTMAVGALWSCTATHNPNGSYSITFAPDMTIHAVGLEDTLHQLTGLLANCLAGTWQRPCTPSEISDIENVIDHVLDAKVRLHNSNGSGGSSQT
jgi:hypothetical protein